MPDGLQSRHIANFNVIVTSKVPGRCPWIKWMGNSNLKKTLKIQNGDILSTENYFCPLAKKNVKLQQYSE